MSSASARSRWRCVLTPRWLAWHAFTAGAVWGMVALGEWQFHRAESGNALSWAYTFEWPLFALFGVFFWAKTIYDEGRPRTAPGSVRPAGVPGAAGDTAGGDLPGRARLDHAADPGPDDEPDPELEEYNAYLAQLSRRDSRPAGSFREH